MKQQQLQHITKSKESKQWAKCSVECSGVTVSQILSNHSIATVKMEEKQLKPWGYSWTNKITQHFPIGLQIF